jgi:hypothetical protein
MAAAGLLIALSGSLIPEATALAAFLRPGGTIATIRFDQS